MTHPAAGVAGACRRPRSRDIIGRCGGDGSRVGRDVRGRDLSERAVTVIGRIGCMLESPFLQMAVVLVVAVVIGTVAIAL
jgi:hypothetical protein